MSPVIGQWIMRLQDAMPGELRNSPRWRLLLPLAAGTGRERESERLAIMLDWMWGVVLPQLLPRAENQGFGAEWEKMLLDRVSTAYAAAAAAAAVAAAVGAPPGAPAYAAANAAAAAAAAATASTAYAAANAAASYAAASTAALAQYWENIDPCGLLEKLITLPESKPCPR
jgi:hypothetical protein